MARPTQHWYQGHMIFSIEDLRHPEEFGNESQLRSPKIVKNFATIHSVAPRILHAYLLTVWHISPTRAYMFKKKEDSLSTWKAEAGGFL